MLHGSALYKFTIDIGIDNKYVNCKCSIKMVASYKLYTGLFAKVCTNCVRCNCVAVCTISIPHLLYVFVFPIFILVLSLL